MVRVQNFLSLFIANVQVAEPKRSHHRSYFPKLHFSRIRTIKASCSAFKPRQISHAHFILETALVDSSSTRKMQQSVQKRARQQLSCTACRHGKLRCNRQQPCDQCFKRSKASSCQYLTPPEKKSKRAKNTKDRIAHLEGLVVQLMNQNSSRSSSSPGSLNERDRRQNSSSHSPLDASAVTSTDGTINQPPHSDLSDTATVTAGQLKVANGETSYHGSAHWEAILQDVSLIIHQIDLISLTSPTATRLPVSKQGSMMKKRIILKKTCTTIYTLHS